MSGSIATIVVQFGLATIPWWPSSASGLTSVTTSGTSSCIRHALELSTTTAPAAANLGAHSRDVEPPALNSARSKPSIVSSAHDAHGRVGVLERPALGALGRERHDLVGREAAAAQDVEHDRPDRAGGAATATLMTSNSPNGFSGRIVSGPASSNAVCSERTACLTLSPGMTHEILIGRGRDHLDVDALVAERLEHLRRDAGMRLHSRADDRDLPHRLVGRDLLDADLGDERLERRARGRAGRRAGR